MPQSSKVQPFDRDAGEGGGYVYTTNQRTSSRIALQRHFDLIREAVTFDGRRVLDIGCGDGFSTERFFDEGSPRRMVGLDPAPSAIGVATGRRTDPGLHFVVGDGHRLPWPDDSFDLVLIQGVLHHDDHPVATVREAFRVAPEVLILEPNGNNMGLKVIEKASRYHREHHERSYPTRRLLRWVEECGGTVVHTRFGGFVPMFCPDWMAQVAKALEARVEASSLLAYLGCAVIVVVARRPCRG
ncbi:MAG: class I SAM-dependent methyltransferase [Actinobacteria bacterium]|nr:MAG: class I SAM-dependent methyltransferase [Actinomycetota bacterium]